MENFFTNKSVIQKIIIALVIVILFNFLVPVRSQAGDSLGGDLLKELVKLVVSLGDIITGMFNHFMLGTTKMYSSAIMNVTSEVFKENSEQEDSSLYYKEGDPNGIYIKFSDDHRFDAGVISRRCITNTEYIILP